jgi:hypothetical protein
MKQDNLQPDNFQREDELRPEYDLTRLQVRRLGPGRNSFGGTLVRLEPDVAEMFPNADAVNEALRFLVRVTQEKSLSDGLRPAEGHRQPHRPELTSRPTV